MATNTVADRLLASFSTRLDSALILAIAAEVDDDDHESEATAKATLQALADAQEVPQGLEDHSVHGNNAAEPSDGDATETTLSTTTTDEEAVERAFQAWTLEESADSEPFAQSIRSSLNTSDLGVEEEDPIAFLKNLFPSRERVELQLAYDDAGEDIESCIETLLTEDFLIQEEEEYLRSLSQSEPHSETESLGGKGKKHRQRTRKSGKQTVSLTSTPRGLVTPHHKTELISEQNVKPNVWVQTDSSVLYLSQLLSVPPGTLSSLFYSNNNSLPLAVSKILNQAEMYHEDLLDESEKLAELRQLFPLQPLEALRRCLYATEGDLPKTVELYKVLDEIHTKEGTPLAHSMLLTTQKDRPRQTALAAAPGAARQAEALQLQALKPGAGKERPPTAQECLILASTVRNKRDDAYRSAARTWRSKHALGNSGVAAYWADHAPQLDREARIWELRAARATVDERRTQARTAQAIDLHGLTASQALTVTSENLVSWWHNPSAPASLTIVTGVGKHSAGQAPIILPAIKKLLEREGYNWNYEGSTHHRGSLVVTGLQGRKKQQGGW